MRRNVAGLTLLAVAVVILIAAALVFLPGTSGNNHPSIDPNRTEPPGAIPHRGRASGVVRFGFDPRLDPVEEARIYTPFLQYLERKTGRTFELRFTRRNETIIDNLGNDLVQFAAVGSVSFVKARQAYGAVGVARGLGADGAATYRSAIVARPENALGGVADLKGRSFAFGDVNSTQGHLIPRLMLLDRGIALEDLGRYEYTGSHQRCAEAVIAGRFDAGGMQDTLARELEGKKLIRVVAWSADFPGSGIAASSNVPPSLRESVRDALLDFNPAGKDGPPLYHWERTEMAGGFARGDEGDYDVVVRGLERLGLMGNDP